MLLQFEFVEHRLEHLVVVDELVLGLCVEVDLVHGHASWVHSVHELAVHRPGGELFDFGERESE